MVLQRGYTRPFSREKQTRTPCPSPCGWFVVLGSKLLHVSIRVCLTEDGTHLKGCVPVFFPVAIQLIAAGPHPSSIPEGTVSDAGTVLISAPTTLLLQQQRLLLLLLLVL